MARCEDGCLRSIFSCDPHKTQQTQRFYLAGDMVLSREVVQFTLLRPQVLPLRADAPLQRRPDSIATRGFRVVVGAAFAREWAQSGTGPS